MRHSVENAFMRKWMTRLFSYILILATHISWSQNIPLDSWRTHFSYNSITKIVRGNGKIFAAADNGLFYVDVTTNELNTLSKTDGLSDAKISALKYDESAKILIIGYESGLIDIHAAGKVTTIQDLNRSSLVGNKKVYDIASDGVNAYLGTNFGVLVVSLQRKEITDNFRSIGELGADVTVNELKIVNDRLFILTDGQIQSGLLSNNLLDFNNWELVPGLTSNVRSLTLGDKLYAIQNDTAVVTINSDAILTTSFSNNQPIVDLAFDQSLFALIGNEIINTTNSDKTNISFDVEPSSLLSFNGFWIGTRKSGILNPNGNLTLPNGPASDKISNITFDNGNLFAFYGPSPENYLGEIDSLGFDQFDNNTWTSETIRGFYNITDGRYFNGRMIYSSSGFGIYDQAHSNTISGLTTTDENDIIIPRLALANGSLYAPSFDNNNSLYIWDKDESMSSYSSIELGTRFPMDIQVSRFESFWISRSSFDGGGFLVRDFENNETRIITIADGLPSNQVNGLAIDLGDEAWVATSAGSGIFSDASFIFNNLDAIEPIYDNQVLLEDEEIYAISVDGGNRIWMSAESGLYIFDNTLSNLEHHFTTENSPLLSHVINDFAYNSGTGEMYINTNKGLISYRSNASRGRSSSVNTKIYPNPVRPGYSGQVGISELSRDSIIKITDVNGKLIRSLEANGGTASWDLYDYNNRRVSSGVYVVLVSSKDGIDTVIGKIAVLN